MNTKKTVAHVDVLEVGKRRRSEQNKAANSLERPPRGGLSVWRFRLVSHGGTTRHKDALEL